MIFVTTCSKDYQKPWIFPTLGMVDASTIAILDPGDDRPLPVTTVRRVTSKPISRFYQHGVFLDHLEPISDDQIVVLADADAVIQRDFDDEERTLFDRLGDGFAVGYNMRQGQLGIEELGILRLKTSLEVASKAFGLRVSDMTECPMYNFGLVVAKVSTWKALRALWDREIRVDPQEHFVYETWQQYLICCLFHRHGIPVSPLGYKTHSHGHFRQTREHWSRFRRGYYGNDLVMYAHFWAGVSH